MKKQFYRTSNVLALLGISRSTLTLWISKGKFPEPQKLGKKLNVWNVSDIDAWVGRSVLGKESGGEV